MARPKRPPFIAVDLDYMADLEVQKLVATQGRGAAMLWIEILIKMQKYEAYDFRVPMDEYDFFCSGFYEATKEDVKKVINFAVAHGWLKIWTSDDGRDFFYNERRYCDLLGQTVSKNNRKKGLDKMHEVLNGRVTDDNRADNRTDNRADNRDE